MKLQTQWSLLDYVQMFMREGYEELARIYTIKLVRSVR